MIAGIESKKVAELHVDTVRIAEANTLGSICMNGQHFRMGFTDRGRLMLKIQIQRQNEFVTFPGRIPLSHRFGTSETALLMDSLYGVSSVNKTL
jgi:hypothetical protein